MPRFLLHKLLHKPVIANISEAIQSSFHATLDCFVASLLAMTIGWSA